jgi:LPXTG-motif cell wall-anchored protein
VEVEGTKSGRDSATGDAASGLPPTGDGIGAAHLLAAGTALVAGGAAVVARSRRTAPGVGQTSESYNVPEIPDRPDGQP